MQYAVLIYAPEPAQSEDGQVHDRHARELRDAGRMAVAFALESAATATSIRADAVTDGPFVDAKEVIAGFYVIDAPDLDVALRLAKICPAGNVEVRPVLELPEA